MFTECKDAVSSLQGVVGGVEGITSTQLLSFPQHFPSLYLVMLTVGFSAGSLEVFACEQ